MITFNASLVYQTIYYFFHVGVTNSDGVTRWGPHPLTLLVTPL